MLTDESDRLVCYESPLPDFPDLSDSDKSEPPVLTSPNPGTDKSGRMKRKRTKSSFRMNAKGYSITFPQNATSKSDAAARIDHKWNDVFYVISQEKHKDGNFHLHIYLEFPEKRNFKDSNCFDFIAGKHGDYATVRSRRDWIRYVVKHDDQYTAKGIDVKSILAKKAPKNQVVAEMIDEGKSLEEVREAEKGYFLINKRKIEEYGTYMSLLKKRKEKETWKEPDLSALTDTNLQIGKWLLENIRKDRVFKAPQLFIHGPRNLGKTSLIESLEKSLSIFHVSITEDFYDGFDNDYDLVVIDEFKGQKTIQWMNEFLQGSKMTLRMKGKQYLKEKNVPVIILSNFSLAQCYPRAHLDNRLDTLECRLEMIEVDSFIKIF